MTAKQIIGWFLISAGVLLIAWTLYSSWQIFTGEKNPPEVFKIEKQTSAQAARGKAADVETQAQELISKALQEQLKTILPADFINKSLNLFSWSIFAWILIFGGGQIAGMGIKLLR